MEKGNWSLSTKIAYECNSCKKIILGPPKIRDDTSIHDNIPLSGRLGYNIYCSKCNAHLYECTSEVS